LKVKHLKLHFKFHRVFHKAVENSVENFKDEAVRGHKKEAFPTSSVVCFKA
jgi:hypothetical protein